MILQTRGIEKGVNNQPVMVRPSIVTREIWGRISYFKRKFRSRCVAPLQFTSHGYEALGHYERSLHSGTWKEDVTVGLFRDTGFCELVGKQRKKDVPSH